VELVPFIVTYNGMAAGPCADRCVEHLMAGAPPSFGAAIERIDIYAHCQIREPINVLLSFMYERFQDRLTTLPFLRFRRKPRLFEIGYVSGFIYAKALFSSNGVALAPADFNCLCREFAAALSLVRRRIRPSDDFDIDGLDVHLRRRIESLE
jgi:hypothetical protein